MQIYIYSAEPLKEARGNLEDDLDDFLQDAGEVSGGGSGAGQIFNLITVME